MDKFLIRWKDKERATVDKSIGEQCLEENIRDSERGVGAAVDEVCLGKEKGKPTRKFQDGWKRTYTWLSCDSERQRLFCSICVTATNQGLPKPTMARQIDSFRC